MNRNPTRSLIRLILLFLLLGVAPSVTVAQHGFSVHEYEHFHDVLHPLEHEALPKKDYRRIRTQSGELVKRGRAIVRLGIPAGVSEGHKAEFADELKKFDAALSKLRSVARRGSNTRLKAAYSDVHDYFEMLASKLPRN